MKIIVNLLVLISGFNFCSVTQDFKFADLEEQIDYAGAIVQGEVSAVSNQFNAVVTLKNVVYYRGCLGSKTVQIARFVSSATCGNGIPKVGDKLIAFTCENPQGEGSLKLNQFVPYTGWVKYNAENVQKIQQRTGHKGTQNCSCRRGIEKCLTRDSTDTCSNLTILPELTGTIDAPKRRQDPIYEVKVDPEDIQFPINLTGTIDAPQRRQDPIYEVDLEPQIQKPNNRRRQRPQVLPPQRGRTQSQRRNQPPVFEIKKPEPIQIPEIFGQGFEPAPPIVYYN